MPDVVRGIVHTVNQQSWWGVCSDLDPRRKLEARPGTGPIPQMSRIEYYREVRTRTLTIGFVYRFVSEFPGVAHRRGKVPAGRKPDHADLVRIDAVGRGSISQQTHRTLRVLQGKLHLRRPLAAVVTPCLRNPVFQHDAGYAPRCN